MAKQILIGRAPTCNLRLDAPEVSREHARLRQLGNEYSIEDLHSRNGTYVNGQPIRSAELHEGDLIEIGNFLLVFQHGEITPYTAQGMRVDVIGLTQEVPARGKPLRILDDINMTILPGEFVALVGASGAGKSTLLNALIGSRPGSGKVKLNGHDFYGQLQGFRAQLGYVPQNDILHTTLTVEKALDYAARLRLPSDISGPERGERITAALDTVSMNTDTIRKTRIGDLSGGQRKRVSIAAELLADPKLIYLDEATSGLDPGLEKKMMYTLRRMADEGRTVAMITHATANIVQTDHVAFLSQGRLVYFGPSHDSLDFFGVEEFADIYDRIEGHGAEWLEVFEKEKPGQYQKYVVGRHATLPAKALTPPPKNRSGFRDFLRQWWVLTQRTFRVLISDRMAFLLMLLLFPLTAAMQLVIAKPDVLTGNLAILADPVAAARTLTASYTPLPSLNIFIFITGLSAVFLGLYVPATELIKERSIYRRERLVNLGVLPYLLSKAFVFLTFAAVQTVLYLLVLSRGVHLPANGLYFPAPVELFITLFLTLTAAIGLGFILSAVSHTSEAAIYALVMVIFTQFFFAGAIFDLRKNPVEPVSYATTIRWSLTALGVTLDVPRVAGSTIICSPVQADPQAGQAQAAVACFNYPDARKDLMIPYDDDKLILSWAILAGMTIAAFAVTGLSIKRLDRSRAPL
jgi:ABC-type multidrug transport system ATPase subunit